jgi:hypothetical protein
MYGGQPQGMQRLRHKATGEVPVRECIQAQSRRLNPMAPSMGALGVFGEK